MPAMVSTKGVLACEQLVMVVCMSYHSPTLLLYDSSTKHC